MVLSRKEDIISLAFKKSLTCLQCIVYRRGELEAGTPFRRLCHTSAKTVVAWAAVAAMKMSYIGYMLAETMNLVGFLDTGCKKIEFMDK